MSLTSLSTEVLFEVVRQVDHDDLASLSLSCRYVHILVEPQLYEVFTQTGGNTIQAFFRSLIAKPHRMKYVKHITACSRNYKLPLSIRYLNFDQSGSQAYPEIQMRELLPDAVFGKRHCDNWNRAMFTKRGWDPIMALLLVLCTQLESINFSLYEDSRLYPFIKEVLEKVVISRNTAGLQAWLSNFHRIDISPFTALPRSSLSYMVPYLTLESVNEFNGHGIGYAWRFPLETTFAFNVAKVTLSSNTIDYGKSGAFLQFLGWFQSMKSFAYEGMVGTSRMPGHWTIFSGLRSSKNSLEELKMSTLGAQFRAHDASETWSPITSLQDFEKLRTLDIDAWMFLSWRGNRTNGPIWETDDISPDWLTKLLPRSLEHVTLREYKTADFGKLERIFTMPAVVPTALKTMRLLYRRSKDVSNIDIEASGVKLEEAALNCGIVLTREPYPDNST